MTKKEFKELCSHHVFTGGGQRHNVFFFDWKENVSEGSCYFDEETQKYVQHEKRGWKYGVASRVGMTEEHDGCTKAELFNYLYNWVVNEEQLPFFVRYKFAADDSKRFKTPLSLNW